ncbi:MAG TPA: bifunctional adenosylcobinamide kinase/adenosylcobinamide-phosphate guanylyltransferase [Blastocatellia bacterium]
MNNGDLISPASGGRRGETILVLGGARAGKSTFAANLAREIEAATPGQVAFVATAEALDEEMAARIEKHRAERPANWLTIEEPRDVVAAIARAATARVVIVDCFTLLVSNWLLSLPDPDSCETELGRLVRAFSKACDESDQTVICVSNEVGLGLVPDTPIGRLYRDCLGKVNQLLAASADRVYWLVAGIPVQIKPRG